MSEEIVILGQGEPRKKDGIHYVTTPQGETLRLSSGDILRSENADASGNLKRYIISASAVVAIEVEGRSLSGLDAAKGTILKWVDDGGTISKSRDDT